MYFVKLHWLRELWVFSTHWSTCTSFKYKFIRNRCTNENDLMCWCDDCFENRTHSTLAVYDACVKIDSILILIGMFKIKCLIKVIIFINASASLIFCISAHFVSLFFFQFHRSKSKSNPHGKNMFWEAIIEIYYVRLIGYSIDFIWLTFSFIYITLLHNFFRKICKWVNRKGNKKNHSFCCMSREKYVFSICRISTSMVRR